MMQKKEDVTLVSIKDENGGEYHSDKARNIYCLLYGCTKGSE